MITDSMVSMRKLILFDIDGTLTKSSAKGLHHRAFEEAVRSLHRIEVSVEDRNIQGMTDRLILSMLLKESGVSDKEIEATIPKLLDATRDYFLTEFTPDTVILLPGVKELLQSLNDKGATLHLLTGNIQEIAKAKLGSLDIYKFFCGGGFGNDPHVTRGDLIKYAIEKAGFAGELDNVYLVGDTPKDITAGKEAELTHLVGVATGFYSAEDLKKTGAKTVLIDFKNTDAALAAFDAN